MADTFDISAFGKIAPIEQGQPQAPDVSAFGKISPEEPGASVSDPFTGLTSSQPMNKSDLSFNERYEMGFGNARGQVSYLKQKGYDAKINDKGDLVYRKPDDKMWRYVDEKNSWSLSEMLKDVAEAAPEIATFAAQAGVGVAATALGGAGILATGSLMGATAGAVKAAAASFGRHYKTYEADPAELVGDIALETAFNFAGGAAGRALELGAAPTAEWVGNKLAGMAQTAKDGGESSKNLLSFLVKTGLNTSDDASRLVVDKGAEIGKVLSQFPGTASTQTIKETLDTANAQATKGLARYYNLANKTIFKADERAIIKAAEENGLNFTSTQLADDVMGAIGPLFDWTVKTPKGKAIAGNASLALQEAGGDLSKIAINLKSNAELTAIAAQAMQNGDEGMKSVINLLSNETGRNMLHDSMNRVIPNILAVGNNKGGQAAKSFMSFRKLFADQLWDMRSSAIAAGNESLGGTFSKMADRVGSVFLNTLDNVSPQTTGAYSKMLDNYKVLKNGTEMFHKAVLESQRLGSDVPFYQLYNQLKGTSTLATARNQMLAAPEKLIAERMPKLMRRINSTSNKIDINLAAQSFAPWINPRLLAYAAPMAIGSAVATGGESPISGGIAAGALLTSPRLAAKAFGAAARFAEMGAASASAARIASLGPDAIKGMQLVKGLSQQISPRALKGAKAALTTQAFGTLLESFSDSVSQGNQQRDQLLQQGLGGVR